jgi:hypothetical protein
MALEKMREKGPEVLERMTSKMNLLMFKLQSFIVGTKVPEFFPSGAPNIIASVRAIPARVEGTVIHGEVQAGGPRTTKETMGGPNAGKFVDYAQVQEAGVAHSWMIQPVLYSSAWAISQKKRALSARGLPKALAFLMGGQLRILRSVMHPGLEERPYMRDALADMSDQIYNELQLEMTSILE